MDKLREEKRTLVNLQMLATDKEILLCRSDPAQECAEGYYNATTERFELTNQEAQNYEAVEIALTSEQIIRGVARTHSVGRRALLGKEKPPPPHIVEEINGLKYCSCLTDVNTRETDRHTQCMLGGKCVSGQLNSHFYVSTDVPISSNAHASSMLNTQPEHEFDNNNGIANAPFGSIDEPSENSLSVGIFVTNYSIIKKVKIIVLLSIFVKGIVNYIKKTFI